MPEIRIDIDKKLGTLKPVNGIDNGPVTFGGLIDCTPYFLEAGFPHCRLHDTNWPHPWEVDIHTIFRDFDADENDPKNYHFYETDKYLHEVIAAGCQIVYRLGSSIEHAKVKHYIHPPKDFDKWARICLNIARHYNEGWADGFHMGIEYWEVWNEPDHRAPQRHLDAMWSGTPEQYYALYAATVRLMKDNLPGIKIGGYAACTLLNPGSLKYCTDFLTYVMDNNLPLDFFSFHTYTSKVENIRNNALVARETLDKFGFTKTEMMLNEWNYLMNRTIWGSSWEDNTGSIWAAESALKRSEVFEETSGIIGAAFTAAALIEMCDVPIDIATFYDGQPTSLFGSIFDRSGYPTKQYYPFIAFNELKKCGERVGATSDIPGMYTLASASGGEICAMLTNFNGGTGEYPIAWQGLDPDAQYEYEEFWLDGKRDLESMVKKTGGLSSFPKSVFLHQDSMILIRVKKV